MGRGVPGTTWSHRDDSKWFRGHLFPQRTSLFTVSHSWHEFSLGCLRKELYPLYNRTKLAPRLRKRFTHLTGQVLGPDVATSGPRTCPVRWVNLLRKRGASLVRL